MNIRCIVVLFFCIIYLSCDSRYSLSRKTGCLDADQWCIMIYQVSSIIHAIDTRVT